MDAQLITHAEQPCNKCESGAVHLHRRWMPAHTHALTSAHCLLNNSLPSCWQSKISLNYFLCTLRSTLRASICLSGHLSSSECCVALHFVKAVRAAQLNYQSDGKSPHHMWKGGGGMGISAEWYVSTCVACGNLMQGYDCICGTRTASAYLVHVARCSKLWLN